MNALFAELRRRKVVRVAAAYLVTAWLIMQMVNVAVPALELPGWFDGAVFVLLAAGFPLGLLLAWVFDLTPSVSRPAAAGGQPAPPDKLAPIDLVLLAAVAALLGVSSFQAFGPRKTTIELPETLPQASTEAVSRPDTRPSIAVLSFANLSSDIEQEYFSDGQSDEIRNQLFRFDALRVIGRTSSVAFKGQNADARTIGTSLGADYLLDGSVSRSGNQIRLNLQLAAASDGSLVWSGIYARELEDVFAAYEEVAAAVVRELGVALGVNEPARDFGTNNIEAYDHFLRGRAAWNRGGVGGAFEEFAAATGIDPEYGAAWVGLARAAHARNVAEPGRADEWLTTLERAVERAVAASPDRWEAHAISARLFIQQRDWLSAARALNDAVQVELPPAAARADIEGEFLMQVGRAREALSLFEAASASDPLSVTMSNYTAWQLDRTGRLDEARAEYERGESLYGGLQPGLSIHHLWSLLSGGDAAAIRDLVSRIRNFDGGNDALLRQVIESWDSPAAGLAALRAFRDATRSDELDIGMQLFAAYFGDIELALEMTREGLFEKRISLPAHLWHPLMAEVRRTEGFKQIVRDLGLVDYWRQSGDWADFCWELGPSDFECS